MKTWITSVKLQPTKQYPIRSAWIGWPDEQGRYPVRVSERKNGFEPVYTDYLCEREADGSILFAKQSDESESLAGFEANEKTENGLYAVTRLAKGQLPECDCPGRTAGGRICKHIVIARHMLNECVFDRNRVRLRDLAHA